jgi:ribosomal protein S1
MAELMARASTFQTLKKGQIVTGTVKKLTPQEILLDIGAKSDALVIEYDKQNLENLLALLKVGDTVNASVISPEAEEGFPVVSLRRTLDDAIFSRLENEYKEGKTIEITVDDTTRGGFFVSGFQGMKGFLPNSQVMPELLLNPEKLVGQSLEVKIIEFDRARKRLVFSQKATVYLTDPKELTKHMPKGATVEGTIASVTPYGVFVTLEPEKGVTAEGFIHISEVSHERVENLESLYHEGQKISSQVKDIDSENRRVNLSIKNLSADTFESVKEKYPLESNVKGTVKEMKSRGITMELEGATGFIPANKVPTGTTYSIGDTVEAEVTEYDTRRRVVVVTPVLKAKFIGYR